MNKSEIIKNIRILIDTQINDMASKTPMINFAKPLINRFLDNNTHKLETALNFLSDKDGDIDIEGIIDELTDNMINSKSFKVNTGFIGDIEIGNGNIKLEIPIIDKRITFVESDFMLFKELLTTKKINYE